MSARRLLLLGLAMVGVVSCEPVGPTGEMGLEATPVPSVGPPASAPAPIPVQAVYELAADGGWAGPNIQGWFSSEKPPPSGTRLAVVDEKGRQGEIATTLRVGLVCEDGCPDFFMGVRWMGSPVRPLDARHGGLAITPPAACGPACRLFEDCEGGDGPCGALPSGVPLPPLQKDETSDHDWAPEEAVDLDGDGTADLWFLGRETMNHAGPDPWPAFDQVVVQRIGAGWVTVATDLDRRELP
jgi:hypothetical protein